MSDVTVAQFAEVLKVPVDRLLVQLESAGIQVAGPQAPAVLRVEERLEEGQAGDVVEMRLRQEQVSIQGTR